jgi:hypothetical protein
MSLVQDEEMVEAPAADGADHSFHERVLPEGARGDADLADPHPLDSPRELLAVDRVSLPEQESRSRILRERLDDLLDRPDRSRVIRDVEVEEFAALVAEHHEDAQEAERQGGHEETVDGHDVSGMHGQTD